MRGIIVVVLAMFWVGCASNPEVKPTIVRAKQPTIAGANLTFEKIWDGSAVEGLEPTSMRENNAVYEVEVEGESPCTSVRLEYSPDKDVLGASCRNPDASEAQSKIWMTWLVEQRKKGKVSDSPLRITNFPGLTGYWRLETGMVIRWFKDAEERHSKRPVQGVLSRGEVWNVIRKSMGAVQSCYEKELKKHGPNPKGKLTYEWVVKEDGSVRGVELVEDTMKSEDVSTCVADVISQMRFPKPKGGVVKIKFPFIFKSG